MTPQSTLYAGSVVHRRMRPRRHRLRYRVFWMLLDLAEIDDLDQRLRLFSHNRFNVVSFHDRDHGEGSERPLRQQIDQHLAAAGLALNGGPVRLLCMPRIFGYGFNPLSVYFCYHRDGGLAAIVYEVHNTFGQRHSYLIPVDSPQSPVIHQTCDKVFHVSPFMDMDLIYRFRVESPRDRIALAISTADQEGVVLTAALSGQRQALSDGALLRLLTTHPMLSLKVIAAIHWHAARMLAKGFRWRPRPRPPSTPVTAVSVKNPSP